MEIDADTAKKKLEAFSEQIVPHIQEALESIGFGTGQEPAARKHVAGMFFAMAVADALQAGVDIKSLKDFLQNAADTHMLRKMKP